MRLTLIKGSLLAAMLILLCICTPVSGNAEHQEPRADEDTVELMVDDNSIYDSLASPPAYGAFEMDEPENIGLDSLRAMYAGRPAAVAFAALPDSIVPLLKQNMRLDLLDYAISGQKRIIKNELFGHSWLDSLASNYIDVHVTGASAMQIGVYAGSGKNPDMTVVSYTLTPIDAAADSQLIFYNAAMQPIDARKLIKLPDVEDFLKVPSHSKLKVPELAARIPFPTVVYTLDPTMNTLTATITVRQAMTIEDFNAIKPYLHPTLTYRWNGKRFTL